MTRAAEATKRWAATPSGVASAEKYRTSEKGKATALRAKRAWKERNAEYVTVHRRVTEKVRRAVRSGALAKSPCANCGAEKVQAHHANGYAPDHILDVVWLCPKHHKQAHRENPDATLTALAPTKPSSLRAAA